MAELPAERVVRAARLRDAAAICELMNEIDRTEIGAAQTAVDDVVRALSHPGADLDDDSWLVFRGRQLVAHGLVWDAHGAERVDADHYVLPGYEVDGGHVLDLIAERSAAVARRNGVDGAVVHLHLTPQASIAGPEMASRGWRVVRRHQVMIRHVVVAEGPMAPAGVSVRTAQEPADQVVVHRLLDRAFDRHFDHHAESYEQWRANIHADRLDWSLVWIASLAGVGDVGALLARNDRESMGWIRNVGVLEQARGRGIGSYLLQLAFGTFAERGRDQVGLGVDMDNVTDALGLYENLGMRLHFAVDTWELRQPIHNA